jgi:alpha-tubulin suppressor-like RCC1 family protein
MSERYPGGLIRKTPPTVTGPTDGEGGSAPGIWTLEEVAYYEKAGLWPVPPLDKELYAWGRGDFGQLGNNENTSTANRSSPIQVGSLTTWSKASNKMDGGSIHTLAIKTDGTLWAWGYNDYGQLGQNDVIPRSSPVQVGVLTTWDKVFAASNFTMAIKTDGTLWAMGENNYGQLGQNDVIHRSSPVQVGSLTTWASVNCGGDHANLIKTDGTLWGVGYNNFGELGLNPVFPGYSSPVQIGALTDWLQAAGDGFDASAIKTDGTLWAIGGQGGQGQLGINSIANTSSPVQVGALTNWSVFDGGYAHRVAVKNDGTLWTWGWNDNGQMGIGDAINASSPTQVGSETYWSKPATSQDSSYCITTSNTLYSWGENNYGQLGQNDLNVPRSSPVQIGGLTTWYAIAAGKFHILGVIAE